MSRTDVGLQLAEFAGNLIEQSGGMVDWDEDHTSGTAIVPPELAESLGQHEDVFPVRTAPGEDGLSLTLGGEFLDLASRTIRQFVPATAAFAVSDLPVRKTEFDKAVESSFGWQNARGKVLKGGIVDVSYHSWWFHAVLQSEDTWESLLTVTLNSKSKSPVRTGDLLNTATLSPASEFEVPADVTLQAAADVLQRETMQQAKPFLDRIDATLQRDRKRLRDYYQALQREAGTVSKRTKVVPSAEELQDKLRVVRLELQRKLSELEERYAISGVLRPIAMAEFRIPAVAIDVEIQRKAARRVFRLYWNAMLRQMEPVSCSRCHRTGWNFWFTNDDVEPYCSVCHEQDAS